MLIWPQGWYWGNIKASNKLGNNGFWRIYNYGLTQNISERILKKTTATIQGMDDLVQRKSALELFNPGLSSAQQCRTGRLPINSSLPT